MQALGLTHRGTVASTVHALLLLLLLLLPLSSSSFPPPPPLLLVLLLLLLHLTSSSSLLSLRGPIQHLLSTSTLETAILGSHLCDWFIASNHKRSQNAITFLRFLIDQIIRGINWVNHALSGVLIRTAHINFVFIVWLSHVYKASPIA